MDYAIRSRKQYQTICPQNLKECQENDSDTPTPIQKTMEVGEEGHLNALIPLKDLIHCTSFTGYFKVEEPNMTLFALI